MELKIVPCACRMSMGPRGSFARGSATFERALRAMGSTCTVTSRGQDSTFVRWMWARRPPTLASVPKIDLLRYPSPRLWGGRCLCSSVPVSPVCLSVPVSPVCVWAPGPPWEEGSFWELELAFLLLPWLVTTLMNI